MLHTKTSAEISSQKEIRRQLAEKNFEEMYNEWEKIKLEKRLSELALKEHNLQNSIDKISNSQELKQQVSQETKSSAVSKPTLKKLNSIPVMQKPKKPIAKSNTAPQEKSSATKFLKRGSSNLACHANKFATKPNYSKEATEYFTPSEQIDKFVRNLRK